MEEGSLRCDANVSLRPVGADAFGTKVEIKNMNSIRSLERALAYEIERQTKALETGERIVQETRHWDDDAGATKSLRTKEEAFDYRYFPEPDIPPLEPAPRGSRRSARRCPSCHAPGALATATSSGSSRRWRGARGRSRAPSALFEGAVALGRRPGGAANWVTQDVAGAP